MKLKRDSEQNEKKRRKERERLCFPPESMLVTTRLGLPRAWSPREAGEKKGTDRQKRRRPRNINDEPSTEKKKNTFACYREILPATDISRDLPAACLTSSSNGPQEEEPRERETQRRSRQFFPDHRSDYSFFVTVEMGLYAFRR